MRSDSSRERRQMSKAFNTTLVTLLIAGAILITIITVLVALCFVAAQHNKQPATDSPTKSRQMTTPPRSSMP